MGRKIYDGDQVEDGILRHIALEDPRKSWFHYDDFFHVASPTTIYEVEGAFAVQTTKGGAIRYTSGAVAGNRCRINSSIAALQLNPGKDFVGIFRKSDDNNIQVFKYIGFFSALPTAAVPPVEPADGIFFRMKDGAAAVNEEAVCKAAGVETPVDLGTVDSAGTKEFKIVKTSGQVLFFVDGVQKARITTNIPSAFLAWGIVEVTQEAVAKAAGFDALKVWSKR